MHQNSCYVVVNPAAGNGRAARQWPRLERELVAHRLVAAVGFSTGPDDATQLTRRALKAGHETIIAVGGDGTLNEVVNGFFDNREAINPGARLGIICCGTGSDFVRSIGVPNGRPAIASLAAGKSVALDLGFASFRNFSNRPAQRYFLNFADVGLGGETVRRVNATSKAFGGFASFLWGAIRTILSYRHKVAQIALDDSPAIEQRVGDIVAANGVYFAGGMRVAPEASLVDGRFDVFVLGAASKLPLLFDLLPRVYFGAHTKHPAVWWRRARRLAVRSDDELLLDLDGELVGTTEATMEILPRALQVIVPRRFAERVDRENGEA